MTNMAKIDYHSYRTPGAVGSPTPPRYEVFQNPPTTLPNDSQARKDLPIYSGVMAYFPAALVYVAKISKIGNDKHNPGEPLHWARGKSADHLDCCARHMLEADTKDEHGMWHAGMLAWRALANLQLLLEREEGAPKPPGAV